MISFKTWLPVAACQLLVLASMAQVSTITIHANKPGAVIQPTMYGIFFEDINFAADGGLYAELVKNRSFEFADPWMGWDKRNQDHKGSVLIINRGEEFASNPRFARINVFTDTGHYSLVNEGFRGMGLLSGAQYDFTIRAKNHSGQKGELIIELLNEISEVIGKQSIEVSGKEWKKYEASVTSTATTARGRLRLWFRGRSVTDIDMVSLFPKDTWKGRPGGLRKDLVQWLADMKPGFIRFPGGCIVEGRDLANRYQWKKTVGTVDNRQLIINRWNTEFRHRSTPDYFQSFGLGFYEYFLLCEDLGAEPLPILNCGMACQFNTGEVVPVDELDPYIQDALDLVEFANGDISTRWGKLRADMGHPAPFNLKMIGVGNEQWGPQYIERYRVFASSIRNQHPEIKLISSLGPNASGPLFDYLNPALRALNADILDEHYYLPPDWFLSNASRYDNYDRNGPKIFAGEYAAHVRGTEGIKRNTWLAALAEAAFITGLERNADVVHMSSYAPLFAHADAWQWAPDLIWYDNLRSYGTPSYYVQQLFSVHKGSHVIPALRTNSAVAGQDSLYATASTDSSSKEIIIKLVNASDRAKQVKLDIAGKGRLARSAQWISLNTGVDQLHSFEQPRAISTEEKSLPLKSRSAIVALPPYSVNVFRIKR